MAASYLDALLSEMAASAPKQDHCSVDSIYFGGGTPTVAPSRHLSRLLSECKRLFRVSPGCEISMEGNPGDMSREKVNECLRAGVNRVSLGAQSFDDQELRAIGRRHTSRMIADSVSILRECGLRNLNLDLILGLPGQTAGSWRRNLESTAALLPQHISIYMLDLDDDCPLQGIVARGEAILPEEDLISDLYLETVEFFREQGYQQYEISNFALPEHRCRHNEKYWRRRPVLGYGVGSHSFDGRSRYANARALDEYLQRAGSPSGAVEWCESITEDAALSESLFLGLRLADGVDWSELRRTHGGERLSGFESALRDCAEKGLAEWRGVNVRLTPRGMLVSNEIFQSFI